MPEENLLIELSGAVNAFVNRSIQERNSLFYAVEQDLEDETLQRNLDYFYGRSAHPISPKAKRLLDEADQAAREGRIAEAKTKNAEANREVTDNDGWDGWTPVGQTLTLLHEFQPRGKWGECLRLFMEANAAAMRTFAAESLLKVLRDLINIHQKCCDEAETAFHESRVMKLDLIHAHVSAVTEVMFLVGGIGGETPQKPVAPTSRGEKTRDKIRKIETRIPHIMDDDSKAETIKGMRALVLAYADHKGGRFSERKVLLECLQDDPEPAKAYERVRKAIDREIDETL
ncbi:MAG: hypothetical protein KDA65_09220 [Planctomycetaceae bacterium]|nr:hypothetical protein [Planctomycetaceae bacterium]